MIVPSPIKNPDDTLPKIPTSAKETIEFPSSPTTIAKRQPAPAVYGLFEGLGISPFTQLNSVAIDELAHKIAKENGLNPEACMRSLQIKADNPVAAVEKLLQNPATKNSAESSPINYPSSPRPQSPLLALQNTIQQPEPEEEELFPFEA